MVQRQEQVDRKGSQVPLSQMLADEPTPGAEVAEVLGPHPVVFAPMVVDIKVPPPGGPQDGADTVRTEMPADSGRLVDQVVAPGQEVEQ